MFNIITADGVTEYEFFARLRRRDGESDAEIERGCREILAAVRSRGMDAVGEYSLKFDGFPPREITRAELETAYHSCDAALIAALERAARNIREYQSYRIPSSFEYDRGGGAVVGQIVRPLHRVGIYVPGGRAAYPSSVLMTAIPARVAGVDEIIMTTPPGDHLNPAVLAAAHIAGVDRVFAVGGVQPIGALAYGAGDIPRVDKIVGPGSAYVAAAKRLVYGTVDIDMVAGPSEVLIIADGSASPRRAAADLLSQAEHDPDASAVLVTTCPKFARSVAELSGEIARNLPRREIIEASVRDNSAIIVCNTLDTAITLANEFAPEHLEILTENPRALLPGITDAGAVFLGENSPEPLGDYMAGPSHVLPTSGSARFFSPLGVDSFLKRMSVIEYTAAALDAVARDIITIARAEDFGAHANSIEVRQ